MRPSFRVAVLALAALLRLGSASAADVPPAPRDPADELEFAAALVAAGLYDLAEDRLARIETPDVTSRVERAIDGVAGVRLAHGLALRDRADATLLFGRDEAAAEALRARAREALEGARRAVEEGWKIAGDADGLTPDERIDVDSLERFALLRHAEASLELARLHPKDGLPRRLLVEAAIDSADRFLWETGDGSPWSSAAYLVHGAACLERAATARRDAGRWRVRGLASLAAATTLTADLADSPYRLAVAERALAARTRALREQARTPDDLHHALAAIEEFRARAAALDLATTAAANLVRLEEASVLRALGEDERARQIVEEVGENAATVRGLVEARRATRAGKAR